MNPRKYPRLELHQVAVASFCGRNESVARDHDPHADTGDVDFVAVFQPFFNHKPILAQETFRSFE